MGGKRGNILIIPGSDRAPYQPNKFGMVNGRAPDIHITKKTKLKKGGKVMAEGGDTENPLDQEVLDWHRSYTASPKYRERLGNFYRYPDYVQRQRVQQVNDTRFNPLSDDVRNNALSYYPSDNTISVYPKGVQEVLDEYPTATNKNLVRQQIVAHELGHSTNSNARNKALRLNPYEERFIFDRNRLVKPTIKELALKHAEDVSDLNTPENIERNRIDTISNFLGSGSTHDLAPGETKSDLDAARFLLNKKGIYDARTQDFNADILKKARGNKDIQQSPIFQRLQENYDDDAIIELLNKVAVADSQIPSNVAKNGKKIKYENGGGLSRSKDYGSKSKPYPSVPSGDFAGGGRSYPIPTKADAVDALRLAGLHGRSDVKAKVYAKYPELRKANMGIEVSESPDDIQTYFGDVHNNPSYMNYGGCVPALDEIWEMDRMPASHIGKAAYGSSIPVPGYLDVPRGAYHIMPDGTLMAGRHMEYGGDVHYGVPLLDYVWDMDRASMPEAKSGIHIKPENRGKFNAYKKRTGKTTEEALHSKNPHVRQMANFARNAAKWHHAANGYSTGPGDPYDLGMPIRNPMDIDTGLQNPIPQDPLPVDYMTHPFNQQMRSNVSDYFNNDPYKNMVPNDASLNGPDPYQNEYMLNPRNNKVQQSNYTPLGDQGQNSPQSGRNFNVDLSLGPAIVGLAGVVNKAFDLKRQTDAITKNKRKNLTMKAAPQHPYGTGSQGIYRNGGPVPGANKRRFSPDEIDFLASRGYNVKKYQ